MRISDWSSDVCSSDLPCQYSTSQREIETDGDSSRPPAGESPRSAASTSSKVNQRASSSSSPTRGSSGPASAKKPSISDDGNGHRSEEHTSELQSLMRISYAVFCLKKKIKQHKLPTHHAQ